MAAEGARARAEAAAQWDAWFAHACDTADGLLGCPAASPQPGLPGNPLAASSSAAENPAGECPALSIPRTVSEVSVSALARALAGPARGVASTPRSPFRSTRSG